MQNEGATQIQEEREGDKVQCEGEASHSQGWRASTCQQIQGNTSRFSELFKLPHLQAPPMLKTGSEAVEPQIDY